MGRGLGWGTPRGPCQPRTFCDSVSYGHGAGAADAGAQDNQEPTRGHPTTDSPRAGTEMPSTLCCIRVPLTGSSHDPQAGSRDVVTPVVSMEGNRAPPLGYGGTGVALACEGPGQASPRTQRRQRTAAQPPHCPPNPPLRSLRRLAGASSGVGWHRGGTILGAG